MTPLSEHETHVLSDIAGSLKEVAELATATTKRSERKGRADEEMEQEGRSEMVDEQRNQVRVGLIREWMGPRRAAEMREWWSGEWIYE